jgi:hypothetical protein
MKVLYLISAPTYERAISIAREMGVGKYDFKYIAFRDGEVVRRELMGMRVEHESQLVGPFSSAERVYLTNHLRTFSFSKALELVKQGKKIGRIGWNGKGMWLEIQRPTDTSKMTLPYIFMKTADDNLVPWLASQTDMLTDDWVEIK